MLGREAFVVADIFHVAIQCSLFQQRVKKGGVVAGIMHATDTIDSLTCSRLTRSMHTHTHTLCMATTQNPGVLKSYITQTKNSSELRSSNCVDLDLFSTTSICEQF